MGISKFFSKFVKSLNVNVVKKAQDANLKGNTRGLCFDLNGVIHPIAQKVFMYGGAKKEFMKYKSYYHEKGATSETYDDIKKERSYMTYEELEKEFFEELRKEILRVLLYFAPYEFCIIAIDGIYIPAFRINQSCSMGLPNC